MRNYALEARCSLALSRVLAKINPGKATEHFTDAQEQAFDEGCSGRPMSAFIAGEPALEGPYHFGRTQYDGHLEYLEIHPPIVWGGEYRRSDSGGHETKAVDAQSGEGFLPGLIVSRQGGDADPTYDFSLESLELAIQRAKAISKSMALCAGLICCTLQGTNSKHF
jgi:hypothetical protein